MAIRGIKPCYFLSDWTWIFCTKLIFIFLSSAQTGFSQELPTGFRIEPFPFSPIETEPQTATCIAQDSTGFLWFGSFSGQIGLKRYDGSNFRTYRFDPSDSTSISSNIINEIYVSPDHQLWISTNRGLNRYISDIDGFARYYYDSSDVHSLSHDQVGPVVQDLNGYIWVGTHSGLNRLDVKSGQFKRYKHIQVLGGRELDIDIYNESMLLDQEGILWFTIARGEGSVLCRFDTQGDSIIAYWPESGSPYSHSGNSITCMLEDSRGNFWIGGVNHELYLFDKNTGRFTPEGILPLFSKKIQNNRKLKDGTELEFIFEDKDGKLWIEDKYPGVRYYDPQTQSSQHFEIDPHVKGFPNVDNLFQSSDGTIWALMGYGVHKISPPRNMFPSYPIDLSAIGKEITFNRIYNTTCYENASGELWVGNNYGMGDENGLMWISPDREEVRHYPPAPDGLQRGFIFSIYEDSRKLIWISSVKPRRSAGSNRLYQFDPQIAQFNHLTDGPTKIVVDIQEDEAGNMWFTTQGQGLFQWNAASGTYQNYLPSDPDSLRGYLNFLNTIYLDSDGTLWLGGGMNRYYSRFQDSAHTQSFISFMAHFDPQTGEFEIFELTESDRPQVIHSLNRNPEGELYGATYEGIFKFDEENTSFTFLKNATETGWNRIASVAIDEAGYFWVATSATIILLDPSLDVVQRFTSSHGIKLSSHFYDLFPGKSERGNFFLADYLHHGLFSPEAVRKKLADKPSKVILSAFFLNDREVKPGSGDLLPRSIRDMDRLELNYEQNVFGIQFGSVDFGNPALSTFLFKLENYDKNWRNAGKDRHANYVNVPPGEYVFRIKTQNSFGQWSEEKKISIYISPPWWQTGWAYAAYLILFVSGLWAIRRYEMNRQQLRHKLELENLQSKKLKEVFALKNRFFAQISHEFRTPLTLMLGPVKELMDRVKKTDHLYLQLIERNGERLLNLINQLLELSRLEAGGMSIEVVQLDLVPFMKQVFANFSSLAETRCIQYHFDTSVESLFIHTDREKLERILFNLLSNAFKFTPENGEIRLALGLEKKGINDSVVLSVSDTGPGIAVEHLSNIFNRFYQVAGVHSSYQEGSGIGLALVKELVELLHGKISVKSTPGSGTTFEVSLPPGKDYFSEADFAQSAFFSDSNSESLELPDEKARQIPNLVPVNGEQPLVLLVEDNQDMRLFIRQSIDARYRLLEASNGEEGLAMALKHIPDIIISDVMMPVMDGLELCQQLKANINTSHIPLIMLTAKADIASRLEGLEYGADVYLAKPFDKRELEVRMRKLMELRKQLHARYGQTDFEPSIDNRREDAFVLKVRQLILDHLSETDFDIERLSSALAMDRTTLHRKLKALTGKSASIFIRQIRLQEGYRLLKTGEMNVSEVAYTVGFSDPSYFSKLFSKAFGKAPSQI